VIDDLGTSDTSDDLFRYNAPSDSSVGSESFTYTATNSEGHETVGTVTITLDDPAACDVDVEKRKQSGLGWCYETYLDSFDTGKDTDGTGNNIALQAFIPHPWHQRQHALESGAVLAADEPGYAPLFVHSHGFGGNKEEDFSNPETYLDNQVAKRLWLDGYNVISYTQRGFGGSAASGSFDGEVSGDSIQIMAPSFEGFDFIRVVDWAICHFRADSGLETASDADKHDVEAHDCDDPDFSQGAAGLSMIAKDDGTRLNHFDDDPALGTVGYSYGGGFQFLAQSVDNRVDAIMPMGTWHDLRYSLHPNDTPKRTWILIMTSFASTAPGLGGGNGEPLPPILTEANAESLLPIADPARTDAPHAKGTQVSVDNANILAPKGPVAFCNGHQQYYADKFGDADGDPEPTTANQGTTPSHYSGQQRAANAHLFMIQGYGDTLFNYNEGFDSAKCFEDQSSGDVRFLAQTSGHPFPTIAGVVPENTIPPQYAGSDTGMYLDEVVHCGLDETGQPQLYNMVVTAHEWFNFHLRNGMLEDGKTNLDDIFPKACVTQQNADPSYKLDSDYEFFNGTNTAPTAFKYSREGVVFDSVGEIPVGGSTPITIPATSLTTGVAAATTGATNGTMTTVPLYTASEEEVLAGIPTVHLNVTRTLPQDEIFYAGTYIKRCQVDPSDTEFDGSGAPTNCDAGNAAELLHFQVNPIRVFRTDAGLLDTTAEYPQIDPRNFADDSVELGATAAGSHYPVIWGDNPATMRDGEGKPLVNSSLADPQGRLPGISARLYPGDEIGLALMAGHIAFLAVPTVPVLGSVSVSGSMSLPLVANPPAAPGIPKIVGQDPDGYVIETP
jgi:pimeloyl-ACP methyl ester carboxylesterase